MPRQPGLDDRHRNEDGRISQKHGNTEVKSLRETYGENFAPGVRSDMHLKTLLERSGQPSLSQYLKNED